MKKSLLKSMLLLLLGVALSLPMGNRFGQNSTYEKVYAAEKPSVTKTSVTLYAGYESYKIQFNKLSQGAKVTYKSSNKAAAVVTDRGYIKPIAKGKTVITVTIRQSNQIFQSSMSVIVKEPYLTITNSVSKIAANSTYAFIADAVGLNRLDLSWTSSDEQVGVIDGRNGVFTAMLVGETTIKLKDRTSGKTKSFTIEVIGEDDPDNCGFDIGIEDDEVIIYGLKEAKDHVLIPAAIGGYPVTTIASWAFYQSQIKSITFGENITYIGDYAFFCSTKLTKALLQEGVVELADHSFDGCSALVEFNIPDSVRKIGGYAFDGCSRLLNVKVDNEIVRTIGEHVFNNVALSNPAIAYKHNVLFHLSEGDKEEIAMAVKALEEMDIEADDADVLKVKKVHDWIIYNVMWESKENDIVKIQKATGASDLMIALKYHIGVCEHYMVAFQTFMEMAGIENLTILNVDGTHGWNMVKLDGEWYMIDVSHDGPNGYLMYRNFLFNRSDIYVDWGDLHTYDTTKYPIVNGSKYTNYVDRTFSQEIVDVYENMDLAAEYR